MRRGIAGVLLAGLITFGWAVPAKAAFEAPPVPTPAQLQATVKSLVPARPTVVPPDVDASNPTFPSLPYVAPPAGLQPALTVASPTTVLSCQAAYLGPLAAIVALSKVFATAGVDPPVAPSFLSPAFGPVTTACVLAPYPSISSCGPDGTITDALADHPDVPIPSVGGLPTVDPFASVPAPFASVVVILQSIENDLGYYVYGGQTPPEITEPVETELVCH